MEDQPQDYFFILELNKAPEDRKSSLVFANSRKRLAENFDSDDDETDSDI